MYKIPIIEVHIWFIKTKLKGYSNSAGQACDMWRLVDCDPYSPLFNLSALWSRTNKPVHFIANQPNLVNIPIEYEYLFKKSLVLHRPEKGKKVNFSRLGAGALCAVRQRLPKI